MAAPSAARPASLSSTSPFSNRDFRALWTGALGSHVGTWMQNVAAAWLMTSLTTSPALVALVQTATSLPIFLLALPSGALADIVNRRRLLLVTQSWMCAVAFTLSALTFAGAITPWVLLLLTFTLGPNAPTTAPPSRSC
jgi:MFS family permease